MGSWSCGCWLDSSLLGLGCEIFWDTGHKEWYEGPCLLLQAMGPHEKGLLQTMACYWKIHLPTAFWISLSKGLDESPLASFLLMSFLLVSRWNSSCMYRRAQKRSGRATPRTSAASGSSSSQSETHYTSPCEANANLSSNYNGYFRAYSGGSCRNN